ncbi:unnamed protein product [Rhizoctonia solani]|uniref:Uncharacterized protein n=1 Tax=Rhizoctonia solani TaxID=456999 RepID=A0A8H2WDT7_9AGAM|nr:unnamed protein product [Rhizoctonia solani]
MESSDDEMDIIERAPPRSRVPPSKDLVFNERDQGLDDDSEEILTSDPEELAEILANRSLEKYIKEKSGPSSPDVIHPNREIIENGSQEQNFDTSLPKVNSSNSLPSLGSIRSPPRDASQTSSPTQASQSSVDSMTQYTYDNNAEAPSTPQPAPPNSSPNSTRIRYSPPDYLQYSLRRTPDHSGTTKQTNPEGDPLVGGPSPIHGGGLKLLQANSPRTEDHSRIESTRPLSPMSLDEPHLSSQLSRASSPALPSPTQSSPAPILHPQNEPSTNDNQTPALSPTRLVNMMRGDMSADIVEAQGVPDELHIPVHGRTLRTRTARQQHPYAIEYAQYRRTMLQAGLNDAIIRPQVRDSQDPQGVIHAKHPRPLDPEMREFIVPEDEESQDLYVPPPSPQHERRNTRDEQPTVNMDDLLAGFGGALSDDDTPTRRAARKDKGKENAGSSPKRAPLKPKPFPLNAKSVTADEARRSPSPITRKHVAPSTLTPRIPQSDRFRRSPGSSSSDSNILPESDNDSDSSATVSSSGLSDSLERKRMRILNRMMPAAWVRRQAERIEAKRDKTLNPPKRQTLPQTGGTKRNLANLQRPLVLLGDSESEDDDSTMKQEDDQLNIPPSPVTHSIDRSPAPAPLRRRQRKTQVLSDDNDGDIVEISSSDERSISSSAIVPKHMDDDEISSWLTRRSPVRSGVGGDLINRMLSRTGEFSRNTKPTPKKRAGYKQDGTKMKQAKLTSMFRASSQDGVIELSSEDDRPRAKRTSVRIHLDISRNQGHKSSQARRTFTIRGDWADLLDGTVAPTANTQKAKDKTSAYNRTASTSNLHIREGPGSATQNSGAGERPQHTRSFDHKTVSTDCGILPFVPHTKFAPSTYIGRGFLQNLLDAVTTVDTPPVEATPVVVFGEHLDVRITGSEFVEKVRYLVLRWTGWLLGQESETELNVQRSFRYVALMMTHILEGSSSVTPLNSESISVSLDFLEEDATEILALINSVSQGDPAFKDSTIESSINWLSFHWFFVELAARIVCGNRRRTLRISTSADLDSTQFDSAVQVLIRALLSYSISDRLQYSYSSVNDLNDPILEIWVCLIYLVDETRVAGAVNWKPLWIHVEHVLDTPTFSLPYKVFESERRWEYIFAFSALNMFSSQTGRLMPSHPPISRWAWVCKTIKDVRLKEDSNIAGASARQQRIDFYVRTIMARCWLLHTMWGWNYQHYDRLFTLIYPIFQSRKLAKLKDEKTDFPPFIRHLDLESLDRFSNGDSAWSIFLKIFRRAIVDNPGGARKLYSTCMPIGVLNFTDENPATDMDLSRLLNRFAILLVILITEPTQDRAVDCAKRIQALIPFHTADMRSREACIRAFQYAGLLLKFYKLDFAPLASWMRNMVTSLQEGMKKATSLPQRNRLAVLVLCLLRGVSAVVSTAGFDRDTTLEYPETGLLIPELFQLIFQVDMKSNPAARREIRLFLEAFCNAREAFIARLLPKPIPPIVQDEESQESYGFNDFELDLNDPDVLAGLDAAEGDEVLPTNNPDPLITKERNFAELVRTTISPVIFENVILGLGLDDRRLSVAPERENDQSEEYAWVKVWVSCVKIVVENHQKTWWDYLGNWGGAHQERISRIIDVGAERRVRIQFCYLAMKCAPNLVRQASREQKHLLILPWFQCLPHHRYTVEHKYTALICDRGLTSNPILEGLPCRSNDKGEHYVLSTELMAERLEYVRRVLGNLNKLARDDEGNPMSTHVTRGREYIAKFFETMKHTWEYLGRPLAFSADCGLVPSYLEFCNDVRRITGELLLEASVKDMSLRLSWVPRRL